MVINIMCSIMVIISYRLTVLLISVGYYWHTNIFLLIDWIGLYCYIFCFHFRFMCSWNVILYINSWIKSKITHQQHDPDETVSIILFYFLNVWCFIIISKNMKNDMHNCKTIFFGTYRLHHQYILWSRLLLRVI